MIGDCRTRKRNYSQPIDLERFLLLYRRHATIECMQRAEEIETAWRREDHTGDRLFAYYGMLGAIYEAGRIQGIRDERARRRAPAIGRG